MSTHNICFYGELPFTYHQIPSLPVSLISHSFLERISSATIQNAVSEIWPNVFSAF